MQQFQDRKPLPTNSLFLAFAILLTAILIIVAYWQIHTLIQTPTGDISSIQTFEHMVRPDDTLWSIAEQYKPPRTDTREFIYYIRQLNNTNGMIHPGEILLIPKGELP